MRVSINASGWGSVNLCQFTHHSPKLGYTYREEVALLQPWSDFDPYPLVGTSIFYRIPKPRQQFWDDRLAKDPYQKNTPPAVKREPANPKFLNN